MSAKRAAERAVCEAAKKLRTYQKHVKLTGSWGLKESHYIKALDKALDKLEEEIRNPEVNIDAARFLHFTSDGREPFPTDAGKILARACIAQYSKCLDRLIIDCKGLRAELIISAYFNSFLQEIYDTDPDLLPKAQKIQWLVIWPFQKDNIERWNNSFKPYHKEVPNQVW